MKRPLYFIGFIFLFVLQASAGSLDPIIASRVRNLTLEGLESAYNFDLKSAYNLFDEAIAASPLHPRPYVGRSTIYLWRYLMGMKNADYEAFLSSAEKSIDVCEEYIDRYGEDADALICLGTVYGYRAFVYGRAKSYLKSAWDGKKSFDYFNDALKLDPKAYDAYAGTGVYHYFSAFLPKALQWIVSILGVTGDSELALKELRLAAEKGTYTKTEARYYLAQFLPWQEGNFDSSEKIITDLGKQYPSNSLFSFTLAVWEIRRNDVRSAKDRLELITQNRDTVMEGVQQFARYKLAECNFRLGNFDQANELYRNFLSNHHDETYTATSNYRVGLCYELTGKRTEALPFYLKASEADGKFGDDAYAVRRAAIRLKTSLSPEGISLVRGQNALKRGDYAEALTLFKHLTEQQTISTDLRSEAVYGLGETLLEQGSYQEALEQFQIVGTSTVRNERWLLPWSLYQSGICLNKLGNRKEARKKFEQAADYDDYDFRNWLHFRSEQELAKLKK